MERIKRHRGSLLSLAAGGALGAAVEFMERGASDPVSDMAGRRLFHRPVQ